MYHMVVETTGNEASIAADLDGPSDPALAFDGSSVTSPRSIVLSSRLPQSFSIASRTMPASRSRGYSFRRMDI
jgi:hypothetical protein